MAGKKIKLILFISRTTADVQTTNMKNDIQKARRLNTDDIQDGHLDPIK
jgi:hypothetical protein